jgi:hypothetical protein
MPQGLEVAHNEDFGSEASDAAAEIQRAALLASGLLLLLLALLLLLLTSRADRPGESSSQPVEA